MSNSIREVLVSHGLHGYNPARHKDEVGFQPYRERLYGNINADLIQDPFNGNTQDWTQAIARESYLACAEAKVFARATFNFSPQILEYLYKRERETHDLIVDSDRISKMNFGGHGSAIMQGLYYHLISPFESEQVKDTMIHWSKVAFEEHFGRKPEGAWLPEAAVDHITLEILAKNGIKFTILAPWQASGICKIGTKNWEEVGTSIDPSRPYTYKLTDGRSISIFFFDDHLGEKIAHNKEGIYSSPYTLHEHIKSTREEGLTLTYNDMETLGHHHKNGTVSTFSEALLGLYEGKPKRGDTIYRLTNPAQFLANHKPEYEVEIIPYTSWSCKEKGKHHFLSRWGDDRLGDKQKKDECHCGDVISSDWRAALRKAHEFLNREIEKIYFKESGPQYFTDPKETLKDYIYVVLEKENIHEFLKRHFKPDVSPREFEKAYYLLEAMRFSMIANTSCGWFHNGIKRIEPVINMVSVHSALKALVHAVDDRRAFKIIQGYLNLMEKVPTSAPEYNGRKAFEAAVRANDEEYQGMKEYQDVAEHPTMVTIP